MLTHAGSCSCSLQGRQAPRGCPAEDTAAGPQIQNVLKRQAPMQKQQKQLQLRGAPASIRPVMRSCAAAAMQLARGKHGLGA